MSKIGFIGTGNMGGPMAVNLVKAGHDVTAFDLSPALLAPVTEAGGRAAGSIAEAVSGAEIVVSMLPAGKHVRSVYEDAGGVLASAGSGTLPPSWQLVAVKVAGACHLTQQCGSLQCQERCL